MMHKAKSVLVLLIALLLVVACGPEVTPTTAPVAEQPTATVAITDEPTAIQQ
jgi:hypothetical protein